METLTEKKTANWTLDKAHAKVGFGITHMLVSEVEGSFKDFDIKVTNAAADLSEAELEFTTKVTSIDTHNEGRDQHMQKEDFFDSEKFPVITFKSKAFKKIDTRNYGLQGDLTIRGVTKLVTLNVTGLIGEHPFNKKTIAGFKVTGTIKRSDFGLAPTAPAIVLSNEVNLVVNAEFIRE